MVAMTLRGVLKRAAVTAVVLGVVGCGPMENTGGPESIKRHLVYEKVVGETGVWIAEADGTRPRLLVRDGQLPVVSPDGKLIAYFTDCRASNLGCTYIVPTSGRKPRLLSTRRLDEAITWSPTSERIGSISAFGGREYQRGDEEDVLVSIDVASGEEVTLARAAQFFGWSFSPDGERVVFARAGRTADGYLSEDIDLFVTAADGGETSRITETGDSSDPVWGPKSIAFAKYNPFERGRAFGGLADPAGRNRPHESYRTFPEAAPRARVPRALPDRLVRRRQRAARRLGGQSGKRADRSRSWDGRGPRARPIWPALGIGHDCPFPRWPLGPHPGWLFRRGASRENDGAHRPLPRGEARSCGARGTDAQLEPVRMRGLG